MTDERVGKRLWEAIDHLPSGQAGVVFRHHGLAGPQRAELGRQLAGLARARGLVLAVSRDPELAERLGAALVHNPAYATALPCSRSVHDEAEAEAAEKSGAALAFVSALFPTRSHPGAQPLALSRAIRLAWLVGCPAIALGGMDERRWTKLNAAHPDVFHGYAGISCWLEA
ncbi:thiamine phosphate synthase [Sphingomonas xanthus]|nr:thiamine phosphate synthase [Sphingomonas xanthus]